MNRKVDLRSAEERALDLEGNEAMAGIMKTCWLEGFYAGQGCPIDGPDAEEIAWEKSSVREKVREICGL